MNATRYARHAAAVALGLVVLAPAAAPAQPAGQAGKFQSLEALNADYSKQLVELDRRRIVDLTALAGKLSGGEAESAYREALNLAIARDLYADAQPAAKQYLESKPDAGPVRTLAVFVQLMGLADEGKFDESLAALERYIKQNAPAVEPGKRLDTSTVLAIGEAYLQRLIRAGRFDIARRVCRLAIDNARDPAVKEHFAARLGRLEMLGKAAPPVEGTDIDGKKVSLADYKGKVVLVDFWATWCPPCVAATPFLNELAARYGDQGFAILGINLDSLQEGAGGGTKALRRFLLDNVVTWPSIVTGVDEEVKAYGVETIPASFLIGRDGKVLRVELSGEALDRAVVEALGSK